jgi:DNA-binding transcriptional LysR family regulator
VTGADVELRHLRYFVAIAEEGSLTRAAERLWLAQPGLSTQMRRLEAELGVTLFERHPRGVELTHAGELFLRRARAALAAAEVASATGRDFEAGTIGSVRLGIVAAARWRRVSDVLWRFTRDRPDVELTVLEASGGTLWRDLRFGRLDAVVAPAGRASPDLRAIDLGSEAWTVLVGTGHPLTGVGPMAAEALGGERIAVTGQRDGGAFDRAVEKLLAELGVTAELVPGPPGPALHAAVARNEIVTLTTGSDALPPGVIARRLDPVRTLSFELLARDESPSPALAEFVRVAAASAGHLASTGSLAAVA